MSDKNNIVLIGMPGCGKTTLGRMLSKKNGYSFIDIDEMIEHKFDTIINLFKQGEDCFRQKETICAKEASLNENTIIATGGGIVTRDENMKALATNSIIVFIDRSLDNIMLYIENDTRPLLNDGKDKLKDLYVSRYHLYKKYADIIIDGNQKLDEVLNAIIVAVK